MGKAFVHRASVVRASLCAVLLLGVSAVPAWWYLASRWRGDRSLAAAEQAAAAGNLLRAERILVDLEKECPENAPLHLMYAHVRRRLGRSADAESHLARAGRLGLLADQGRREFGLLYAATDFFLAEGALLFALRQNPDDREVLEMLAEGYARSGRWTDAEDNFSRLIELDSNRIDVLFARADMYMSADYYGRAERDYRHILGLSPGNYRARILLAHCLLSDARMQQAEPILEECAAMRPDSPDPLIGLASCALERRDFDRAARFLGKALELDPGSTRALNELANMYLTQKQYETAIPVLERILRLDKSDRKAALNLAQALGYTGAASRAAELEKKYLVLDQEKEARTRARGKGQ
jgi:tetratricopeptide (TPR) repeat protein